MLNGLLELENVIDAHVECLLRALELRDAETAEHTRRVTALTLNLAYLSTVPENELIHIRRGAVLHDIGKIGIPDSILHKVGILTKTEREAMQLHPAYAYELLHPIPYFRPALDIPYCHHEKWDGTGYPRGLSGQKIPLSARLFAIADVWDALTSDRPYRLAWEKNEALAYLRELSDKQFDPHVVDLFFRAIK